jgi:Fur family peroxide stress response transcriptional regulator
MTGAVRSSSKSPRVAEALAALDRASLRKTPQRVAIVRAFVDDTSHPTAQQIFDRLRRAMPTMSFATVYNTLAALERAGVCRTLELDGPAGEGGRRFDPMVAPHDHAVCDRCGAVHDVPRRGDTSRTVEGFHVRAVERLYRGECEDCRSANPSIT